MYQDKYDLDVKHIHVRLAEDAPDLISAVENALIESDRSYVRDYRLRREEDVENEFIIDPDDELRHDALTYRKTSPKNVLFEESTEFSFVFQDGVDDAFYVQHMNGDEEYVDAAIGVLLEESGLRIEDTSYHRWISF